MLIGWTPRVLLLASSAVFLTTASMAAPAAITGAGSTFLYPIIAKWADAYQKATGVSVNYQSIGSGGGIKQIENQTVDFGASDMPLTAAQLAPAGLTQFPIINGAVVPVVHVQGIKAGELKLDGPTLAAIYLGKITQWDDPALVGLNKNLKLPHTGISVVHRSDGSGTTFIWSNYLSKVSPAWHSQVGEGTAVRWPTGVGGKGNEGVASYVQKIQGSIGYVEYAYALQNHLAHADVQNSAGQFISPSSESFTAAVAGADWAHAAQFYVILTNAPGAGSWPIAGSTFILMRQYPPSPRRSQEALNFFRWAYQNGAGMARELNYVPLTPAVVRLVEDSWKKTITGVELGH